MAEKIYSNDTQDQGLVSQDIAEPYFGGFSTEKTILFSKANHGLRVIHSSEYSFSKFIDYYMAAMDNLVVNHNVKPATFTADYFSLSDIERIMRTFQNVNTAATFQVIALPLETLLKVLKSQFPMATAPEMDLIAAVYSYIGNAVGIVKHTDSLTNVFQFTPHSPSLSEFVEDLVLTSIKEDPRIDRISKLFEKTDKLIVADIAIKTRELGQSLVGLYLRRDILVDNFNVFLGAFRAAKELHISKSAFYNFFRETSWLKNISFEGYSTVAGNANDQALDTIKEAAKNLGEYFSSVHARYEILNFHDYFNKKWRVLVFRTEYGVPLIVVQPNLPMTDVMSTAVTTRYEAGGFVTMERNNNVVSAFETVAALSPSIHQNFCYDILEDIVNKKLSGLVGIDVITTLDDYQWEEFLQDAALYYSSSIKYDMDVNASGVSYLRAYYHYKTVGNFKFGRSEFESDTIRRDGHHKKLRLLYPEFFQEISDHEYRVSHKLVAFLGFSHNNNPAALQIEKQEIGFLAVDNEDTSKWFPINAVQGLPTSIAIQGPDYNSITGLEINYKTLGRKVNFDIGEWYTKNPYARLMVDEAAKLSFEILQYLNYRWIPSALSTTYSTIERRISDLLIKTIESQSWKSAFSDYKTKLGVGVLRQGNNDDLIFIVNHALAFLSLQSTALYQDDLLNKYSLLLTRSMDNITNDILNSLRQVLPIHKEVFE
jgi:hypothetical protein